MRPSLQNIGLWDHLSILVACYAMYIIRPPLKKHNTRMLVLAMICHWYERCAVSYNFKRWSFNMSFNCHNLFFIEINTHVGCLWQIEVCVRIIICIRHRPVFVTNNLAYKCYKNGCDKDLWYQQLLVFLTNSLVVI